MTPLKVRVQKGLHLSVCPDALTKGEGMSFEDDIFQLIHPSNANLITRINIINNKYCLDKQKVRKAIEMFCDRPTINKIYRKLGLSEGKE